MPKRSKLDTARSRAKIVHSAARLFRVRGYRGTNLDDIMRASGLTVGTFYAHFPSKSALLAEAFELGATEAVDFLDGGQVLDGKRGRAWLDEFMRLYVSPKHRDAVQKGCSLPPLISELSRGDRALKQAVEKRILTMLERGAGDAKRGKTALEDQMLASLCMAVGALAFSRAVASKALSNRILDAVLRLSGEVPLSPAN
jgi:TetR/AcrR family transcriptional repressor of nem operon